MGSTHALRRLVNACAAAGSCLPPPLVRNPLHSLRQSLTGLGLGLLQLDWRTRDRHTPQKQENVDLSRTNSTPTLEKKNSTLTRLRSFRGREPRAGATWREACRRLVVHWWREHRARGPKRLSDGLRLPGMRNTPAVDGGCPR